MFGGARHGFANCRGDLVGEALDLPRPGVRRREDECIDAEVQGPFRQGVDPQRDRANEWPVSDRAVGDHAAEVVDPADGRGIATGCDCRLVQPGGRGAEGIGPHVAHRGNPAVAVASDKVEATTRRSGTGPDG